MRMRLVVVGVVILGLVAGVLALRRSSPSAGASSGPVADRPQPAAVTVAVARRADLVTRVTATGTVSALRDARIAPKTPGRVAAVLVKEGERVVRGTPLLRLDGSDAMAAESQARAGVAAARARLELLLAGARPEERSQAANAVAQAKAALDLAEADVERMRMLHAQGAVARQQLDAAETQLRLARAAYDSARQQQSLVNQGPRTEEIAAARAQVASAEAMLTAARIQVRDLIVTAPFAGTIVQRMVEPGESVSPAAPSFLLAQLDEVYVELAIPERHGPAVRQGQSATIQVDALPGRTFTGKVAEIRPAAAVASRSLTVRVRIANSGQTLRPGTFARGTIVTGVRPGVLQIPERAVLTTAGGPVVFVAREGRAARRAVTLGERQAGFVEIRSGLTEGEQVVVDGHEGLTDNQPLAPRASQR